MENIIAPEHVRNYCFKDEKDEIYRKLSEKYSGDNISLYKLRCTCGCDRFIVYQDDAPSVFAECKNCKLRITVYDLEYYPAAVKLKKDYHKYKVEEGDVSVFAIYEYDDEYLYEDDVEFDTNDISWGKIFIANDHILKKILDDETS